ncbi:hypothetical protein ACN4EE_02355 [Geminocystis sp. CENA526]|uniref:hypothetical protein n=1 Tax=Geminocystis sp. CENA526 TaxID=1355871 RepID=UPI003D6DCEC8
MRGNEAISYIDRTLLIIILPRSNFSLIIPTILSLRGTKQSPISIELSLYYIELLSPRSNSATFSDRNRTFSSCILFIY